MSETRKDAVSERARMLRAEDELSKAIGALPLPWGDSALDAPLARIREAINALAATPPTPESDAHREVRKSVVCEKCYGLTSCWCPPTPDLAAVRELAEEVIAEDGDVSVHDTVTLAEYCLALLAAAPRPETGEPSEAMVEAAMQEFCAQQGESYAALMSNASDADKAEMRDDWRHILRAALAAREGA